MDTRLIDALRVVGLDIYRKSANPNDDEWYCASSLGELGPFRSEEWALVEGVRALTNHAAGLPADSTAIPQPFERFLRELDRGDR
ncbi:MAG: hypothetical protein MI924_20580 [Chloroflexales bacterium]|nr:hypothetical protein [Chloroflexales bacterium]